MTAETLLSRLDRVKRTGPGKWHARCPAHDDRGPSLSIRELDDGRVLLHCFSGCGVAEVVAAVGLDMAALFPEKIEARYDGKPSRERMPFSAMDALRAIDFEATVVFLSAQTLARGESLSNADRDRMAVAVERISAALEVAR